MNQDCLYFHAYIEKNKVIYFVSLLRSIEDNIVFDRIENPNSNIFEFFVPPNTINRFIEIMKILLNNNYLLWFEKKNILISSIYNTKKNIM